MSITFFLKDRLGDINFLNATEGQTINDVLIANGIPPSSVIVTADDEIVHSEHQVIPDTHYEAQLIEGYDIEFIRNLYRSTQGFITSIYKKNLFMIRKDGEIVKEEKNFIELSEIESFIEDRIYDTIQTYGLISKNESVLVGLSGGIDSSAMITALSEVRRKRNLDFNLVAGTFEDFDSKFSPSLDRAKGLASSLGIEHQIIDAEIIEEAFNLQKPIDAILQELMNTDYSHLVMYIDHHTTRRALECFAEENNIKKIALGLHASDLLGGWLNAVITNYKIGTLPLREIGDFSYIYPLMFICKKELHLYYLSKYEEFIKQSYPNPWELHPKDRNFYYYLADLLQYYWPGIEHWVLHQYTESKEDELRYMKCSNCGSHILQLGAELLENGLCDVCSILSKNGYLKEIP